MALESKYILAIDLGTSGPKVAIVTTNGEVVDYEFEETRTYFFPGGGAEESPDEWWQAIMTAARRLLSKEKAAKDDIVAICCTSQWSGTVAVDEDGNPLMNAIIWLDSRGAKYIEQIAGGLITYEGYAVSKLTKWIRLTGGIPSNSGKDPIAHILYIKNEHPDVFDRTFKFLEPKDYLNLKLTGEFYASYDSITLQA